MKNLGIERVFRFAEENISERCAASCCHWIRLCLLSSFQPFVNQAGFSALHGFVSYQGSLTLRVFGAPLVPAVFKDSPVASITCLP